MHAQSALLLVLQAAASVVANPLPPAPNCHHPAVPATPAPSHPSRNPGHPPAPSSEEAHLKNLARHARRETERYIDASSTCNASNIRVRKEWNALTMPERKAYVDAVTCLTQKPALTPASDAPGAKVRLDDFVSTHINQTQIIHYTGNFLSWHRHFVWLHENALRDECGYTGAAPYWDWTITARDGLVGSPMVDGSEYSMGGQGKSIPNQGEILLGGGGGLPPLILPHGNGGGCLESGPFSNMSVNLGPVSLSVPGDDKFVTNPDGVLAYNPRCLKRDLTDEINTKYCNATANLELLVKPDNVYDFEMQMQGIPGSGNIGVHGGGHYAMGGDPGRDVSTSPGEPLFFLHHSNIDRTWWAWQMQDVATRAEGSSAVNGTRTFLNLPPSPETELTDLQYHGYSSNTPDAGVQIGDLLKIWEGPYCYIYE